MWSLFEGIDIGQAMSSGVAQPWNTTLPAICPTLFSLYHELQMHGMTMPSWPSDELIAENLWISHTLMVSLVQSGAPIAFPADEITRLKLRSMTSSPSLMTKQVLKT